jgi:4-carboxymuconolactone decarboxylase
MNMTISDENRYQLGREKLFEIHGQRGLDAIDSMADVAPDLCRFVYEFPFGDIYSRPGLDLKSRQLVTISALAALGNAGPQLKSHIHGSLNVGLTREEIVEALTQLAVYAGFPAALNALKIARDVFRERDEESAKG